MSNETPDCRRSVVEVLELLSSGDKQLSYERDVPQISITDELFCMWFDDVYLPEDVTFRNSFSQQELAAMAAFNTHYEKHEKLLPEPRNGVADWLKNENWQGVMREAGRVLGLLRASAPLS